MNFKKLILSTLLIAGALSVGARQRSSFNENWKFQLGDAKGTEQTKFNDSNWRELDVPHDWSIEGEYSQDNPMSYFCGYLPAGIGWYRKTVDVPKSWKGKYVEIAFDGVFMNSTVWANGQKLGNRPYGWSAFAYEIPENLKKDGKITFAVRVDNNLQPSARWYTGSGIYGNTWIDIREKIHIPRSGVFVRTEGSKVFIETEVRSMVNGETKLSVESLIKDKDGKVVAKQSSKLQVANGKTELQKQEIEIKNPNLWSPKSPYLYTLVSQVKKGSKVVDILETRFGVRDIKWIPETGMWLNGENIKLQGVCNHADAGALGVAVPYKITKFRIQQMLDMGCNALRTTHYPRTPEFYELCDEMGMLVMNEVFDGWHKKVENEYAVRFFEEWYEQDLVDWLKRDRNHASVVVLSVGNETHGVEIAKNLVKICHQYDPTRPVTSGHCEHKEMDIFGVNGSSETRSFVEQLVSDPKTLTGNKVFIGTENTHTLQVRGYYRTKTWYRDGLAGRKGKNAFYYPDLTEKEVFTNDWATAEERLNPKQIYLSSYDNATIRLNSRHNVQLLRDIPQFAGSFRWTGYDYIGEAKYHGGWPFKGLASGAVDMANFPKDLYYMYQSQWTTKPMAHILPHWTHPNVKKGTEIPIWVYSNCDEVELFFNGKSLGKQKPGKSWDKMNCQWLVGWKEGEIKAVAYKDGKAVITKKVATASAPSKLALSIDGEPMASKKGDITQVRVTTTDNKGEFYPWGENRSYYKVLGSGKVRALDNGSLNDVEKHFEATSRLAFYGLTRAYIESTDDNGDINLVVGSILGEKQQITSKEVAIDVETLNLRGKAASPAIKVYYTLNGSQPTTKSKPYTKPFKVNLGTTVKALVVVDGKEAWIMEERFAEGEGFEFYSDNVSEGVAGDQAEDAKVTNGTIAKDGKGFIGTGFVKMAEDGSGSIHWYYENDGAEGDVTLKIRNSAIGEADYKSTIKINNAAKKILIPVTSKDLYKNYWTSTPIKIHLERGGNNITLTVPKNSGICIDEIVLE